MLRTARAFSLGALILAAACATPRLQVADASDLLRGDLAFLADGKTPREEVLLRLGEPTGRFEADRILTYPLRRDAGGAWHLGALSPAAPGLFRQWVYGTGSLVLVFGSDGLLVRHSLVVPQ